MFPSHKTDYKRSFQQRLRIFFLNSRVVALASLVFLCPTSAQSLRAENFPSLVNRVDEIFRNLFYDKTTAPATAFPAMEETNHDTAVAPQKAGAVLVIARTSDPSISQTAAKKTLQEFMAKATNPEMKFVTIEDLTGTANEALQGSSDKGGMQSFTSNQQALQFAASQGIPAVLIVSLESVNVRPAKTAEGMFLGNARATVALVSNAQGTRSQSDDASASARSFDEQQISEKLITQLASNLAAKVLSWQPPTSSEQDVSVCEVHAKVEGLSMPSFTMTNGAPQFANQSVPVFASDANVELDGVLVGQTPCAITSARGMHQIKVTRDGLKPYEAVINLTGKNRYDIVLVPSDETLARFNQQLAYIKNLNASEKVTDSNIKVLEGYAKMLRQSGYRIDQRSVSDWGHLSVDKEDAAYKK